MTLCFQVVRFDLPIVIISGLPSHSALWMHQKSFQFRALALILVKKNNLLAISVFSVDYYPVVKIKLHLNSKHNY